MSTFGHQKTLKPLPVPPIASTAHKYLNSLTPILTKNEYQKTEEIVGDFIKPGGTAERLQKQLLKRAQETEKIGKSWLEDWWLEYAYLRYRAPLPFNLSCHTAILDQFSEPQKYTQTQQAARFILGLHEWKLRFENGTIPPETIKSQPICMNQFKTLFTTERVPTAEVDTLVTVKPKDTAIVLVNNQFFLLELTERGEMLTAAELDFQLKRIKEESKKSKVEYGVGEFTTLDRDTWTKVRSDLSKDPQNQQNLQEIQKAFLVIVLDNFSPTGNNEIMKLTSSEHKNRWYDKITNFLFFENSRVSVLLEHSPCDAPIIISWVDQVIQKELTLNRSFAPVPSASSLPLPSRLTWNLNPELSSALSKARELHVKVANTKIYELLLFEDWGNSFIAKKLKASPDTFMQLALQLSFYKLHKVVPATYESVQTRAFLHGRTDVVRTQSEQVEQFCRAMVDPKVPKSTKYLLFRMAEIAHVTYIADSSKGRGCDRHLLGLKLIALENGEPLHPIYSDKAFSASTHHRISSSSVPSPHLFGGFCNVVPDGYGCCYFNKPDKLCVNIVTEIHPEVNAKKFSVVLAESLRELKDLLLQKSSNL